MSLYIVIQIPFAFSNYSYNFSISDSLKPFKHLKCRLIHHSQQELDKHELDLAIFWFTFLQLVQISEKCKPSHTMLAEYMQKCN